MLLVVDAGNTHIVAGLFSNEQLLAQWRLATDATRTGDEYGLSVVQLLQFAGYHPTDIHDVVISCVAPGVLPALVHMSENYFARRPLVVTGNTSTPVKVRYQSPDTLGPDRLVNCVAAVHFYGAPVIVADLGTATTLDCVTAQAEFIGGVIAPGVVTSLQTLIQEAPGLPRVEPLAPLHAIGTNTVECMQSGLVLYAAGAIDTLIRRMKKEMQANPIVVATGGLAAVIQPVSAEIQVVDSFLTLQGLRLIQAAQNTV